MVLLINKPSGPTSHDVVDQVRRILKIRRVGHAGTLDPFAEGLLIILTGSDTKRQAEFMGLDKTYEAVIRLGIATDTYDKTGAVRNIYDGIFPNKEIVEETIGFHFIGHVLQTPPPFSAIKVKGKKAYEFARKGITLDLEPRPVTIYAFHVLEYFNGRIRCRIRCSSGTYVRSIAHDLGKLLGTGAHLESLKRTAIGSYQLSDALTLNDLKQKCATAS